jgi:hypothetical protein
MLEQPECFELNIIPPLQAVTITLNVSPPDLELALATCGVSLCPAMCAPSSSPWWSTPHRFA